MPSSKSSGDLVDLFDGPSQSTGKLPHWLFIFWKPWFKRSFLKCQIKGGMKNKFLVVDLFLI